MVNSYHECRFKELFLYSLQALVKQSTNVFCDIECNEDTVY